MYSKICVKRPFKKKTKIGFQDRLSLNAGQKYCRMLQGEHSATLLTFIELPLVIKIFVLSILEWLLKTGFTVVCSCCRITCGNINRKRGNSREQRETSLKIRDLFDKHSGTLKMVILLIF